VNTLLCWYLKVYSDSSRHKIEVFICTHRRSRTRGYQGLPVERWSFPIERHRYTNIYARAVCSQLFKKPTRNVSISPGTKYFQHISNRYSATDNLDNILSHHTNSEINNE